AGRNAGCPGARGNGAYALRPGHPQHATHQLKQLSKLPVPLLAGRYLPTPPPPGWDPLDAAARANANGFGAMMVALLVPWDLGLHRPPFALSDAGLQAWIASLDLNNPVDCGRWQYLQNCIA